jgi:sRNA-binding carbon storage regulator CsrA
MMDVTTMTIEQIKALAYDQIAIRENAERNLQILNNEIARRAKEEQSEKTPTEKTEK